MMESTKLTERIRKMINTCERIDQLPTVQKMIQAAEDSKNIEPAVADYLRDLAADWEEKFYAKT